MKRSLVNFVIATIVAMAPVGAFAADLGNEVGFAISAPAGVTLEVYGTKGSGLATKAFDLNTSTQKMISGKPYYVVYVPSPQAAGVNNFCAQILSPAGWKVKQPDGTVIPVPVGCTGNGKPLKRVGDVYVFTLKAVH